VKLWAKYKGVATLVLLIVVTPLFVWQYAVKETVTQWRTTMKSRRQITELRNSQTPQIDRHEVQAADREMILSGLVVAELLPLIQSEDLRIVHFSPCVTSETDGIVLATGQLSVQGGFSGIVKLLEEMERKMTGCKIIAAHYRTTKPRNRKEVKTLDCTVYIQQITTKKQ
jgi:hypothetical protein